MGLQPYLLQFTHCYWSDPQERHWYLGHPPQHRRASNHPQHLPDGKDCAQLLKPHILISSMIFSRSFCNTASTSIDYYQLKMSPRTGETDGGQRGIKARTAQNDKSARTGPWRPSLHCPRWLTNYKNRH